MKTLIICLFLVACGGGDPEDIDSTSDGKKTIDPPKCELLVCV
jgi:hypothetical protein